MHSRWHVPQVFTDEKKFDVQQCLNHQIDKVFSRDGSVEGRRIRRLQNHLSVMLNPATCLDVTKHNISGCLKHYMSEYLKTLHVWMAENTTYQDISKYYMSGYFKTQHVWISQIQFQIRMFI